jgi:DNA primase
LPLLKPGRSFRFSMPVGGKDPDDVLRDQGPDALRSQLSETKPFVQALFERERDLEPLDTPERKAGLRQRLRAAATTIADKDLAQAYKDDLRERYDELFQRSRGGPPNDGGGYGGGYGGGGGGFRDRPFTPRNGGGTWKNGKREPPDPGLRPTARVQITGRIKPFHAAIALAAIDHPGWARSYDEAIERVGFGDPRLKPLSHEVFMALCDDHGDDIPLRERLSRKGLSEPLAEIERLAVADAPFLDARFDPAKARALWAACYEAVIEIADAERALDGMRREDVTAGSLTATRDLRDRIAVLQRQISNLEFWREQ